MLVSALLLSAVVTVVKKPESLFRAVASFSRLFRVVGASPDEDLPVVLAGVQRERGGHGEQLCALIDEAAVELGEAHVRRQGGGSFCRVCETKTVGQPRGFPSVRP